jgi:predicted exporter
VFSRRFWPLSLVFVVVAAGVYVLFSFRTTTDISVFFPQGAERAKSQLSKAIAHSELSRTLIVTLEAQSSSQAVGVSSDFEALLRQDAALMQHLVAIDAGPPTGVDEALWNAYQPRRLGFFARSVDEAKLQLSDEALRKSIQTLREKLESPMSLVVSRVAPEDPFLTVPKLLESLGQGTSDLVVERGRYVAAGRFAVLFITTNESALHSEAQTLVFAGLERAATELGKVHPGTKLESTGLARFAQSTQRQIQRDISRISTVSIISLGALCWLLFRSFQLVLLLFVPVAAGMITAVASSLLLWGNVHGITLAVGASLIGVAMDYVLHFYAHHRLCPDARGPAATMRRIAWALALGAITTVVGFLALAASSFPGLHQIAVFSAVGVFTAFLTTWLFLPFLVRSSSVDSPTLGRVAVVLTRIVHWWHAHPTRGYVVVALALSFSVLGITRSTWEDNLSTLTQPDLQVIEEDARVRTRLTGLDTSRVVLAVGADEQEALAVNERLLPLLEAAKGAHELDGFQSIAGLVPSLVTQAEVEQTVRAAGLDVRLPKILEQEGFDAQAFAPFFRQLKESSPGPLVYDELIASKAAGLVRSFRVQLDDPTPRTVILTFLRKVAEPHALSARIDAIPGAFYIDQGAMMTDANRQYRTRTTELLLLGLVGVAIVLLLRYRNPRRAFAALIPAVLSAGTTLAALSLLQIPLNILGLTSLLMVLSMGVDYSVFLVETEADGHASAKYDEASNRELGATLVGLLVSWISNVCGFGLLAMSDQPALRLIGVTAGVGVTSAFLLAPSALVLRRKHDTYNSVEQRVATD